MKKIISILSLVAFVAVIGSMFMNNKAQSIFSQNVDALSGTVICYNTYVCAHEPSDEKVHAWYAYPTTLDPRYDEIDQRCYRSYCVLETSDKACVIAVTCVEYDD